MKRAALLIPLLLCVAAHKKIQSPKAAELSANAGAPMAIKTVAQAASSIFTVPTAVLPPRTNFVSKMRFEWQEDPDQMPSISTFTLYMGTTSGSYTIIEDTGTNLFYVFMRTNWDERMYRHFAVVTSKNQDGIDSDPSNEVHYPPFGPDHFRLTWTSNWDQVTIYETTNLWLPRTNWTVTATVVGTNTYSDWIDFTAPCKFFSLDRPDTLTITLFNPNP
jgi:hypothetical protein